MIKRNPRVFYVGMVCTDAYLRSTRAQAFVGAASGKMISIVASMRLAGLRAILVSLPFVESGPSRQRGYLCHEDGIPAVFLPTWRSAVVRKLLGTFSLAWFAFRPVRHFDTVLFYNHGIEYLLALIILRARGVVVVQDIEDVPLSTEHGLRGFLNRLGFYLMFKLSAARKLTVSSKVARTLNLINFLAIQGVAAETVLMREQGKWTRLEAGGALRIHFGGSLMASTGLDLFCNTVTYLYAEARPFDRPIEFIVTGIGDLDQIRVLASEIRSDWVSVEVHQSVSRAEYFNLLHSCHASLSLKSPESEISSTTFPSKVIEIASHGLALVSTKVSDVSDIFGNDSAWLLPEFSTKALANILRCMAQNTDEVRRRADAGLVVARDQFSPLVIGRALAAFLDDGPRLR